MSAMPSWLIPLSDAERCREADGWAIGQRGVPSLTLMENASQGVARLVQETVPAGRVVVVCGGGNNGGDGYATARILRASGREVVVLEAADPAKLSPDAAAQRAALPGAPPVEFAPEWLEGAGVIVDALLGTGARGQPRPPLDAVIDQLNDLGVPILAVDLPSGLQAGSVSPARTRSMNSSIGRRSLQSQHRPNLIVPCTSTTRSGSTPASWCSPSTFCVTTAASFPTC